MQLRHPACHGGWLRRPHRAQQRVGRGRGLASEEARHELLEELILQRRLQRRARGRHLHERAEQQLRHVGERVRKQRLRLAIMAARRQAQKRARQVHAQPRLMLGLDGRLGRRLHATRLAQVHVGVPLAPHKVGEQLQLCMRIRPTAEQAARGKCRAERLPVHLDDEAEPRGGGYLERGRVQVLKDRGPVEGRTALAQRLDERRDVPRRQGLDGIFLVRVELGVKVLVPARDGGREGAVQRERVIQRRDRLGHHAHDGAHARGVGRLELPEELAERLDGGAARVPQIFHEHRELVAAARERRRRPRGRGGAHRDHLLERGPGVELH